MVEENPIEKEAGFFKFFGILWLLAAGTKSLINKSIEYDPRQGAGGQHQLNPDPKGRTKVEVVDQDGIDLYVPNVGGKKPYLLNPNTERSEGTWLSFHEKDALNWQRSIKPSEIAPYLLIWAKSERHMLKTYQKLKPRIVWVK